MPETGDSAHQIVTLLLEQSGRAFFADDFEAFSACILLPYDIETFDGVRQIATQSELRTLFDSVRAHHHRSNVTDMARHVVEAVRKDSDTVVATFETRLLNGTSLTQAPYPVFIVARRDGDDWKAQHMTFAIEDRPDHNAVLMSVGDKLGAAGQKNPLPRGRQGTDF